MDFCFKHAITYISKQLIPVHPCHFQRETQHLNLCYLQPDSDTRQHYCPHHRFYTFTSFFCWHSHHTSHLILVSTRSNLLARFISTLSVDPEHTRNSPPSPCNLTHLLGSLSSTQLYSACQASSTCSLFWLQITPSSANILSPWRFLSDLICLPACPSPQWTRRSSELVPQSHVHLELLSHTSSTPHHCLMWESVQNIAPLKNELWTLFLHCAT